LHIDALEVRAFCGEFLGIRWEDIVQIAASRVLELVHRLWRPLDGTIYFQFSSDAKRLWDSASEEGRTLIRESWAGRRPDRFEAALTSGASPSLYVTGVGTDSPAVHAHRLLFAFGSDMDFLQGDRLAAWAMDLATAGMAAHALVWTDRYRQFGRHVTEEMLYLAAIDSLFLGAAPESVESVEISEAMYLESIDRELRAAMSRTMADWSYSDVKGLHLGRAAYCSEMADLGMCVSDIETVCRRAQSEHPLEYTA
jgi:hypothetical protein